jgi:L-alanine-DL-glutamate epimerase-like enolase superfamily enzyme
MKLAVEIRRMHPRQVFRISRGEREAIENVFLQVEADGISGCGEASPIIFYRETAVAVAGLLESLRGFVANLRIQSVADIEAAWESAWPLLQPSRAAQCALDLALWDWLGRRLGRTVSELAHGKPAHPVTTFCTIGLSTPEELVGKIADLRGFAAIKIKSDSRADLTPIRQITASCTALTAVDANCAWGERDLSSLAAELRSHGISFIEQPNPPPDDARLRPGAFALPIIADESCVTESDVPRVIEHFDGFNVKLVKCGGLTPALRMLAQGRSAGRKTMVGCMLESSLLIAAGLVAAQTADYADLDGAWLLRDDPWSGLSFDHGVLNSSLQPGFGLASDIFARSRAT